MSRPQYGDIMNQGAQLWFRDPEKVAYMKKMKAIVRAFTSITALFID